LDGSKNMKSKITTVLILTSTIILGVVAIFSALKLYELRSRSVAPNAPARPRAAGSTQSCQVLAFSLTGNTTTPTPTKPTTTPTATVSPTATTTVSPTSTVSPTTRISSSPTPTFPPPPTIPSPPQCTAVRPSAPILTSVIKTGTEATLTWTKVDLATHYTISYGTSPSNLQFGVPNTGNVTSYKIGALDKSKTYYFTVYAVNDCMPSEGSTIVSSVAGIATEQLPEAGVSAPTLLWFIAGTLILAVAFVLAI